MKDELEPHIETSKKLDNKVRWVILAAAIAVVSFVTYLLVSSAVGWWPF